MRERLIVQADERGADRNAQTASAPVTTKAIAETQTGMLTPSIRAGHWSKVRVSCAPEKTVKKTPDTSS